MKLMDIKRKTRWQFWSVIVLALVAGLIAYPKAVEKWPRAYAFLSGPQINLGLDLQGGIHLEYRADVSQIAEDKIDEAMQAVQDVIERRANAFGVAEPVVYTSKSGSENRLVVELAGVKDIDEAKKLIKDTPFLEFKEEGAPDESQKIPEDVLKSLNEESQKKAQEILSKALAGEDFATLAKDNSQDPGSKEKGGELDFFKRGLAVPEFEEVLFGEALKSGEIHPELVETEFGWHIVKKLEERGEGDEREVRGAHILLAKTKQPEPQVNFISTGLTGKNLKDATVQFRSQGLSEPEVSLKFDDEGTRLFAEITKRNVGKRVAIYLDENIISAPTVQTEILSGEASISGNFTVQEAKDLVNRLNEGALPVPIDLISQQSVEASLGEKYLAMSLRAGMVGLALVIVFMLLYYRFLGLVASVALLIYTALMVAIFKLSGLTHWQITLTLPGVAGFVLSIGMAVDANILIFERIKEEIRRGRNVASAVEEGFRRAWTSIRDGNFSSIITAAILIILGTGFVKGFAVTLIIGVLVSMFTAVVVVRTMLRFLIGSWWEGKLWIIGARREELVPSSK